VSILDPNLYLHEQASKKQTSLKTHAQHNVPIPYPTAPYMQTQQSAGAPGMHPRDSCYPDDRNAGLMASSSACVGTGTQKKKFLFRVCNLPPHTKVINLLDWFMPYGIISIASIEPIWSGQHVVCSGIAHVTLHTTLEGKDRALFDLNGAIMLQGSNPIQVR
jgi:hypothetical protein